MEPPRFSHSFHSIFLLTGGKDGIVKLANAFRFDSSESDCAAHYAMSQRHWRWKGLKGPNITPSGTGTVRPDGKALRLGPDSRSKLPAQAVRPLKMAPNLSVHHSGVPGGSLVWPSLQSLEGSSLNSHPGEEDADSGHSCYCAERSAGSLQSRQPWSQAANSTNPQDSKCVLPLFQK